MKGGDVAGARHQHDLCLALEERTGRRHTKLLTAGHTLGGNDRKEPLTTAEQNDTALPSWAKREKINIWIDVTTGKGREGDFNLLQRAKPLQIHCNTFLDQISFLSRRSHGMLSTELKSTYYLCLWEDGCSVHAVPWFSWSRGNQICSITAYTKRDSPQPLFLPKISSVPFCTWRNCGLNWVRR